MKRYETYKDSGIQWWEEIPTHWDLKKAKHIFSLVTENVSDSSLPKIALENIESWTGKYIETDSDFMGEGVEFKKDDILFGKLRPYLAKVYKAEFAGQAVGDIYVFRGNEEQNPEYLKYLLLSYPFISVVDGSTYGAKMPRANWEFISHLILPCPPKTEQVTIAAFLENKVSQIDATIAEKEQMLEDIKAYRSAIISEAVTKGLDKNVEMKDSGIEWIGIIPKTWKIVRIKHILDYKTDSLRVGPFGSSLSGNDFKTEGYWVYNQRVVLDNNFNSNDTFVSQEKYKELSSFKVFAGDILLTTRGTIGKVAIVPNTFHEGVLHPCLIRFRVDDSIVNKDFLAYYFNDTNLILDQVKYNSNSTTIDVIYSYTLKELIVSLPPLDVQNDIVAHLNYKVQKIDEMLKEASQSVENLKSYKSILITEAVTGKIDLREWKPKEENV